MCEMHAFVVAGGEPEMVMESVDAVEQDGAYIRLTNIFGEEVAVEAVFAAIRDNRIYLNKTA